MRRAILVALLLIWHLPGQARVVKSLLEMRHDHVILQQWDLSCGAAALATLLKYQHGEGVSEREVAKGLISRGIYIKNPQLVQIRQGFSLLDLKRYVEQRGYRGFGYGKLDLEELIKRAPMIVPVNFHGYNHFVVFRGVRGNRVLLADPAWGNRTVTIDRFLEAWINYPRFGRVGFMIQRLDGQQAPNFLAPRDEDFVMLR